MNKGTLRAVIEAGLRLLPVARSAYAERDALRDRLLSTDVKLAEVTASLEEQVFRCQNLELEKNFLEMLIERYCTGNGLEIGPGKHPYGPRNRTKYLDKHTSNKDGTPNPDSVADASNIPIGV